MTTKEILGNLLVQFPEFELKGKTMPYTSLNGNMFSFIDKEQNLNLRLAAADREEYVKRFNSPPSVQHGIVMKEYVILTPEVLRNENLLKEYFQRSLTYVATLKAKATKNK